MIETIITINFNKNLKKEYNKYISFTNITRIKYD